MLAQSSRAEFCKTSILFDLIVMCLPNCNFYLVSHDHAMEICTHTRYY